jgi:hypothetical protein
VGSARKSFIILVQKLFHGLPEKSRTLHGEAKDILSALTSSFCFTAFGRIPKPQTLRVVVYLDSIDFLYYTMIFMLKGAIYILQGG